MESTATVLYEILNLKSINKVTVCQSNNKIVYKLASVREAKHYELIEEELRSLQLQSDISIDASNETCPDSNVKSLSETEHEYNFSIPIFSKFYGCCELSGHSEITKDIVVLNKDKLKAWMKLENLFTDPKSSFIEYKIGRITYGKEWDATLVCKKNDTVCKKKWHLLQKNVTRCKKNDTRCKKNDTPSN